jgi:hypothetical protein
VAFPAYRLWLEERATLTEIDSTMSIDDVDLAVMALDEWNDAERRWQKKHGRST